MTWLRRGRGEWVGRAGRAVVLAAAVAFCSGVGAALAPGAAWADPTLTQATPADGAALSSAPTGVTLTFSSPPDPATSHVVVHDAAGTDVDAGGLSRTGTQLHQPVHITAKGVYTVAFHVEFDDGSQLVGVAQFSVFTGIAPPPIGSAARDSELSAVQQHNHDVDPASAVLLAVDVVAVLAIALLLARRRPRRSQEPDPLGSTRTDR